MQDTTNQKIDEACGLLETIVTQSVAETDEIVSKGDIPLAVKHFAKLRDATDDLHHRVSMLQKIVDALSYELLPTMFTNQDVKTINVEGVGRATVNVRWTATMPDKEAGFGWLRQTGNEGLIITTVNAQTLGAFAKTEALAGRPLPDDVFKVSAKPYMSIT